MNKVARKKQVREVQFEGPVWVGVAVQNLRLSYPRLACQLLRVSTNGYYSWNKRQANDKSPERLVALVKAAHQKTRGTYEAERLHKERLAQGHEISLWKVKEIRREHGLVLRRKRQFVRTTDSSHDLPVAPNILSRNLKTTERYAHFSPDAAEKALKHVESFGMDSEAENANAQTGNTDVVIRKK